MIRRDKVVALRILPGVDVLEQRWAAADKLFDEAGIEVVDYFTEGDPAEIKKVVSDELAKGDVQGIWMDAGDGAVSAIEAFEDAGKDYPVMTGEDELSFLRKWKDTEMTASGSRLLELPMADPSAGRGEDLQGRGSPDRMGAAPESDHGRGPR